MNKLLISLLLAAVSAGATAKCSVNDFQSDWQVIMTFAQLNAPDGERVAQRGGSITCDLRFDKRGNYVTSPQNRCRQDGLNYSLGQLRDAKVELPNTTEQVGSCRFQITLDFDRNSEKDTQRVILPRVTLDRAKVAFSAELDVAEADDQFWHAGSSFGFKPLMR